MNLPADLAVTRGSRFAYLTFLYNDAGEAIRRQEAVA